MQYINDNINKEDYTTDFETKKFKSTIESLKKLVKKSIADTKTTKDLSKSECLLSKGTTDKETGIYTPYNFSLSHMSGYSSTQTTFTGGITEKENQSRATISCGFMINNNSNKKEKAFEFIKYSLGERMQRFITFDSTYGDTYNITVNKDALNNSLSSFAYGDTYNITVNKDALNNSLSSSAYGDTDFDEIKEQDSFTDKYASYINSINTYEIRDGYYNDKVIGSLVDDYLQDKISIDNFIANLNSKTKIYLYE